MPKAKKEFDKNSTGMRMCRIGNRNVALFPHTLLTLLNDVEDDDFFQDAYEYARPMNTAECELNFQSEITQTTLLSMSSSMRAFSFALSLDFEITRYPIHIILCKNVGEYSWQINVQLLGCIPRSLLNLNMLVYTRLHSMNSHML